jgi:hypothetical protein
VTYSTRGGISRVGSALGTLIVCIIQVEATVMARDGIVHLLSPNRMLLAKERATLSEFLAVAQQRLQDWKGIEA